MITKEEFSARKENFPIVTGVASNNNIIQFLADGDYDCLHAQCLDCADDCELCENYNDCDNDHNFDDCQDFMKSCDYCDLSGSTKYIGFIQLDNGDLDFDMSSEFAYIEGEVYSQFLKSPYVSICHKCSPCYPGQGDIETAGNSYLAYSPEPDAYLDCIWIETSFFLFEIIELWQYYRDILEIVSRIYKIKNNDVSTNQALTAAWFDACIHQE